MRISVIIPTYNDWTKLMQCLDALEGQKMSMDQYEIIVANNNETGRIPDDINLPDYVRLIHEPQPGSYAARNKAASMAEGDILAFTDADCMPHRYWLLSACNYFDNTTCDLIGGRIQIFRKEKKNRYGYLYDKLTAFQQDKNVPRGKGVTANLLVKKSAFNAVGGFDEAIKSGGDWDFTRRCTEKGYEMIYAEEVLVFHPARNLLNIFKKHHRLTCGGFMKARKQKEHSKIRILGSHLVRGLNFKRAHLPEKIAVTERAIIFSIDITKYLFRMIIYVGIMLRLIDPFKIRE